VRKRIELAACSQPLAGTSDVVVNVLSGRFDPVAASVAQARHLVGALRAGLRPDVFDRVELIVSEMASNAVRHAKTVFDVSVTVDSVVRVEVHDASRQPPQQRHPLPVEATGRGLMIVAAFAGRWGWEQTPAGKLVWAEVEVG